MPMPKLDDRAAPGAVPRGLHVLTAKPVSFFFGRAAELHEDAEQSDSGGVLINHSRNAAQENGAAKRGILEQAGLGLILTGVTSGDVSDLARHPARQFSFV